MPESSVESDPGQGTAEVTSTYLDDYDGFIAKYSPAKELLWADGFGGEEVDYPWAVT